MLSELFCYIFLFPFLQEPASIMVQSFNMYTFQKLKETPCITNTQKPQWSFKRRTNLKIRISSRLIILSTGNIFDDMVEAIFIRLTIISQIVLECSWTLSWNYRHMLRTFKLYVFQKPTYYSSKYSSTVYFHL